MGIIERIVTAPLKDADVIINGNRSFDIQVKPEDVERLYRRVLLHGELGFGEAYMDGWWECDDIAELINRLLRAGVDKKRVGLTKRLMSIAHALQNQQSVHKSKRVAEQHYDIGNHLYSRMLDKRLVYTCGKWEWATTLDQAQEHKLELICRKIGLKRGDRVLDVGCGWGPFGKYAAEKYGAEVVGITLSKEQIALGEKLCEGLPVKFRLMDYRDVPKHFDPGEFDHIVSVGMFEHVGPANYRTYMERLKYVLKPDGYFLFHTIGANEGGFSSFFERYIFPGGYLPSLDQIATATKDVFVTENVENFGPDYDLTLHAWFENFDHYWPEIKATGEYGITDEESERFYRMWKYYLLSCAGMFRARKTHLLQIVLSPNGVNGGWRVPDRRPLP